MVRFWYFGSLVMRRGAIWVWVVSLGCSETQLAVRLPEEEGDALLVFENAGSVRSVRGLPASGERVLFPLDEGTDARWTLSYLEGTLAAAELDGEIRLSSGGCGAEPLPASRVTYVMAVRDGETEGFLESAPPEPFKEVRVERLCPCLRLAEVDRRPVGSYSGLPVWSPLRDGIVGLTPEGFMIWVGADGSYRPVDRSPGAAILGLYVDPDELVWTTGRPGGLDHGALDGPIESVDHGLGNDFIMSLDGPTEGSTEVFAMSHDGVALRYDGVSFERIEYRLSGIGIGAGGQIASVLWVARDQVLFVPADTQETVLYDQGSTRSVRNLRELAVVRRVPGVGVLSAGRNGGVDAWVDQSWVQVDAIGRGTTIGAFAERPGGYLYARADSIGQIPTGRSACEETPVDVERIWALWATETGYSAIASTSPTELSWLSLSAQLP